MIVYEVKNFRCTEYDLGKLGQTWELTIPEQIEALRRFTEFYNLYEDKKDREIIYEALQEYYRNLSGLYERNAQTKNRFMMASARIRRLYNNYINVQFIWNPIDRQFLWQRSKNQLKNEDIAQEGKYYHRRRTTHKRCPQTDQ